MIPDFDPEEEAMQFACLPTESVPRPLHFLQKISPSQDFDAEQFLRALHKTETPVLTAREGCCQEASPTSHAFYIPCNAPATCVVEHSGEGRFRMCSMCGHHNVERRGAKFVAEG